jgi:hypothetical protein
MLRIEKVSNGGSTVLKLSGRIEEKYLAPMERSIFRSLRVSRYSAPELPSLYTRVDIKEAPASSYAAR